MRFIKRLSTVGIRRQFIEIALFCIMVTLTSDSLLSQIETHDNADIISAFSSKDSALRNKIRVCMRKGKYDAALQEIPDLDQRVNELSEEGFIDYFGIKVTCYMLLGKPGEASDFMYSITDMRKDEPHSLLYRGIVDCANNNYGLAIKTFTRYIELTEGPAQLIGYMHRAAVYAIICDKTRLADDTTRIKYLMKRIERQYENLLSVGVPADELSELLEESMRMMQLLTTTAQ